LQAVIANATALVLFKIIIIRRRKKHQQQNANAIALVLLKNNTEKNTSNKKGHPLQRQIACVCVRIYRIHLSNGVFQFSSCIVPVAGWRPLCWITWMFRKQPPVSVYKIIHNEDAPCAGDVG
jgi:hypothetical protein